MFVHRVETPGLAHWSYYIEDSGEAIVVDPRLDVDIYVDLARTRGDRIVSAVETHRNEDLVTGSVELAARTGAEVRHADGQLGHSYGNPVEDGDVVPLGSTALEAIHTPGHTPGHMCYLIRDAKVPWMLFSGDLLLAGASGRVDLGPAGSAEEYAIELYRSLHDRVLPLGDHVLLWPAHGRGSVCGNHIADRTYTSIGIERKLNPQLSLGRRDFIGAAVEHSGAIGRPAYFARMEGLNLIGGCLDERKALPPVPPEEFEALVAADALVVDTRDIGCFLAAHVPDALALPSSMLGTWAGWLIEPGTPIALVSDDPARDLIALARMGFDDVRGFLAGGTERWATSGRPLRTAHVLDTPGVCRRLDESATLRVLDVRSAEEVESLGIDGALNVPLKELRDRVGELSEDDPIVIFCGTGRRSTIAASLLERVGRRTELVLGGTEGWVSGRCPLRGVVPA
jgi:hydroxyacylglutathione hydrolase